MRRSGPIAAAVLVTILLMTLFPPVIRPWWAPATTAPVPSFAFILDERFHLQAGPLRIAVNAGALAQKIITTVAAIGLCLLI